MSNSLKYLLLFLIVPYPQKSLANLSHLACSMSGTHIAAVNGVNISPSKFELFDAANIRVRNELERKYTDIGPGELTVKSYYNQSSGLILDAYETWKLYFKNLEETSGRHYSLNKIVNHFANLLMNVPGKDFCVEEGIEEGCNELFQKLNATTKLDAAKIQRSVLSKLVKNQKVIFLSHSQGAVVVDNVRNYLRTKYPDHYKFTSHLAVARPFVTDHEREYHVNFSKDEVLKKLKLISSNDVPDFNVKQMTECYHPNQEADALINHDYIDCYLGPTYIDPLFEPLKIANENVNSRKLILDSIYRVAGFLPNNDSKCCNKAEGKIWLNDNENIGGFLSKDVKVTSGKVYIENGAQICGEGSIRATSIETDHFFDKTTLIEGKINLNSKFRIENNVHVTPRGELISEIGSEKLLLLMKSTIDGKIQFQQKNYIPASLPYAYMYNSTVKGVNVINGASTIENSPGFSNIEVYNASDLIVLKKIDVKPGARLHAKNVSNSVSIFNDLMTQVPLTFNTQKVNISNGKFYGLSTFNGQNLQITNANFYGTNSITSQQISLSGNLTSLNGECDNSVSFSGSINQSFSFNNCESVEVNLITNGPVTSSGTIRAGGKMNLGGNISVGKDAAKGLYYGLYVSGYSSISAPNGIDTGNVTVTGNFSINSSCEIPSRIWFQMAHYNADFSFSIPGDTDGRHTLWCFDHLGSPNDVLCGPYGPRCDGTIPEKKIL